MKGSMSAIALSATLAACGGGGSPNAPKMPPTFGDDASRTLSVTVGTATANCLALATANGATSYEVTGLPTGVTYDRVNHCLVITPTITGNSVNNPYSLSQTATNTEGTSPASAFKLDVNNAPTTIADTTTTTIDAPVTVSVLANDSDNNGDTLSLKSVSVDPAQGTAVISGTQIVFTPKAGYTGTATVSYIVADGRGGEKNGTLTILVASSLADVGPIDDLGGNPITFSLNALTGLPVGSTVVGVTGFPTVDDIGQPTNLSCNTAGSCTVVYDADGPGVIIGFKKTFPVTVEVQIPGYPNTLKRSQNIIIENGA